MRPMKRRRSIIAASPWWSQASIPRAGALLPLPACGERAGVIGARLSRVDSLPPCGGGMGWGVVPWGTDVPHFSTPTPDPSPQGGAEEFAAPLQLNLAPMRAGVRGRAARLRLAESPPHP